VLHLDDHVLAVRQAGAVDLADGRGGHRLLLELVEQLFDGLPNSAAMVARTAAGGSGGVLERNWPSSRLSSGPTTSGRVLSIWPSLTKVVPSSVRARRMRASRVSLPRRRRQN